MVVLQIQCNTPVVRVELGDLVGSIPPLSTDTCKIIKIIIIEFEGVISIYGMSWMSHCQVMFVNCGPVHHHGMQLCWGHCCIFYHETTAKFSSKPTVLFSRKIKLNMLAFAPEMVTIN